MPTQITLPILYTFRSLPTIMICLLYCCTTSCQPAINSKSFLLGDKLFLLQEIGQDRVLQLVRYSTSSDITSNSGKSILYPPPPARPPNSFHAHGGWALNRDFFLFDRILNVKNSPLKVRLLNYFDLPVLDTLTLAGIPPPLTSVASMDYFTLGHKFDRFVSNPVIHRMDFSFDEDGTLYGVAFAKDSIYLSKHMGAYWQKPGFVNVSSVWKEDTWKPIRKIESKGDNTKIVVQADNNGVYLLGLDEVAYLPFFAGDNPVSIFTIKPRVGKSAKWIIDQSALIIYYAGAELTPTNSVNKGILRFKPIDSHPGRQTISKRLRMHD